MPDILHDFPIAAPIDQVYRGITTPGGLDRWWTARSTGSPVSGSEYQLWFGPEYDWRAVVTVAEPNRAFELQLTRSMDDWLGTRVGFELAEAPGGTQVRFHHAGWADPSPHYRTSCYCWAMYLRILKRSLEFGEDVPYERRLDV